jgi:hypothetical protein
MGALLNQILSLVDDEVVRSATGVAWWPKGHHSPKRPLRVEAMIDGSDLFSSGRRLGQLVWIESSLFVLTGGWVASTPEPSARALLSTASGHFGWHAELLSTLLPAVADGPPTAEWVVPAAGLEDELAALAAVARTQDRLIGLWRGLVPTVSELARHHIAASSPLADGASHRLLGLVLAEEQADTGAADRLLAEWGS